MARLELAMVAISIGGALTALRAQSPLSAGLPAQPDMPTSAAAPSLQVIREIDDPATGDRWLLVRDWNRPGGPGRLLLLAGSRRAAQPAPARRSSITDSTRPGQEGLTAPAAPIIRAGDPLVVEEDTPVVEARLAATALGPAAPGAVLEARLAIGGRIVRVRALAPGRATLEPGLAPEVEVEP